MKPANLWVRALAAVIDLVLAGSFFFLVVWRFGAPDGTGGKTVTGLAAILLLLCMAAYWIVLEWLFGATFGKWMCDLSVMKISGNPINLIQALKRNAARVVDGVFFYLVGFVVAKNNPNAQRIGDLWAKTMVVRSSDLKARARVDPSGSEPSTTP